MEMNCVKCGQSLKRLVLLAMLEDMGCTVSPGANSCSMGGEHEFGEKVEIVKEIDE